MAPTIEYNQPYSFKSITDDYMTKLYIDSNLIEIRYNKGIIIYSSSK